MSQTITQAEPNDDNQQTRPDDCTCREGSKTTRNLACWECALVGFDRADEWSVEVGDRVRADWTEGNGSYDEIIGIVVDIGGDIIAVDIDFDDKCRGGDNIHFGQHDCAPEWIIEIIEANAYDLRQDDEDDHEDDEDNDNDPENLIGDDAETIPEEELDIVTVRALDPSRPLDVEEIAPDMYRVESENEEYTVDLRKDRCTCKGHMYHGKCRHPRRVKIMTGDYELPAEPDRLEIEVDPSMGKFFEPDLSIAE